MTYPQTLEYLFAQLPMYQRVGKAAYKANLDNTLALDEYFGHPHRRFQTIHVAGTNGKGSVSHMIASILMEAGYKVGLYTSPHLTDFRERIRVNGTMISENEVVRFVEEHGRTFERIKPSFFEMTVALAFYYFAQQSVDVAVIEVGLGGRLDSTNIINPLVSVITNIGQDHMDLLGDTLEKIASEKAGIIKPGVPVVVSQRQPELAHVFARKANENNAPLLFANDELMVVSQKWMGTLQQMVVRNLISAEERTYTLDLAGKYQSANLLGVLVAIGILKSTKFNIGPNHVVRGLSRVMANTGLRGRWQTLSESPTVIVDTGHNIDGIRQVVEQLTSLPYRQLHVVLGMVADKDIDGMLDLLPKQAQYYFTSPTIPRAMKPDALAAKAVLHGLKGQTFPNVALALEQARCNAASNDLIFIGGSTFMVADVLSH